ncbi:MAG: hypothetical protein DWH91_18480 [Planctomycetota bacterium]|nr:MAG: hypothetical protein DWH91_18480 [Planctomycetota bacterium]
MTTRFAQLRPLSRQWISLSGWAVLFLGGCASRGSMDLLEAEIRQTEDALHQAESQRKSLEFQLVEAHRETALLRTQLVSTTGNAPLPEQTGNLVRLSGLSINTLLSGGKDRDGHPGDEVLVTLVAPIDQQGDLVKIAGEVEIEAYDMSRPGDKLVGRWTFTPAEAAQAWHSGFVGAGLQFELPWQTPPSSPELVVHARLRTEDGRQLDTSTKLKVAPVPGTIPPVSIAPQAIQPVKFDTSRTPPRNIPTALDHHLPPASQLVPNYEDVEGAPDVNVRPFPNSAIPPSTYKPRPAPPSLDGVQTSDSWTDETIPRLR